LGRRSGGFAAGGGGGCGREVGARLEIENMEKVEKVG